MKRALRVLLMLCMAGLCRAMPTFASGHNPSSKSHSSKVSGASSKSHASASTSKTTTSSPAVHKSTYAQGEERDSHGKIARSEAAKEKFMRMTGHPNGWPGHVVDHIVPLKRGGADDPSNMQWQTVEEAKEKDKWE